MKAEIKALHSPDLDDLAKGRPGDPENFGILVQAFLGPEGEDGEESFDFMVCTPAWLSDELAAQGHIWGRHHLIVPGYDYEAIKASIQELCDSTEAKTWPEVAALLARFGQWEFEDYQSD